jgi:5-bromo-4-chloroindolyl phosphate hydrolysis protein
MLNYKKIIWREAMDKKDFSDLEDQIMDTVKNALNAIDFTNLKKDISDKADDTLYEFKSKIKEYNEKIENKYTSLDKKAKNKVAAYISKKPAGSVSGILYIIFGSIGSVVFGFLLLISLVLTSVLSKFLINSLIGSGILLIFFAASLGLSLKGINLRKRVKRFKQYVKFLDDSSYCLIRDLASVVNKKDKFVTKDLRKMIDLGMFIEGHIDEEKTYFMLNNEVYENYLTLKLKETEKERNEGRLKKQEKSNKHINDSEKEEIRLIIEAGRKYVEQIKIVKNELYKEEFSLKLDKLQNIVSQILNYIEKNPKKLQEVNKFINYYLPMTIKLVNSYKELNSHLVQGENIKSAKNEIEKSIDVINTAFVNLLDDLFEDIALDISTDISVLKTLFKQEGLTNKDFEK